MIIKPERRKFRLRKGSERKKSGRNDEREFFYPGNYLVICLFNSFITLAFQKVMGIVEMFSGGFPQLQSSYNRSLLLSKFNEAC